MDGFYIPERSAFSEEYGGVVHWEKFGGVTGRRVRREHKCDLAGKKINQSIQTKLVYFYLSIENSRNYRVKCQLFVQTKQLSIFIIILHGGMHKPIL